MTPFDATTYQGTWVGSWTNSTFNSTGAARVVMNVNGNSYQISMDLDGMVFGLADPALEPMTATFDTARAVLSNKTSASYGNLTGCLTANGTLTAFGSNVNAFVESFSLTGNWTSTTISATVLIRFRNGNTADATATLTKQ